MDIIKETHRYNMQYVVVIHVLTLVFDLLTVYRVNTVIETIPRRINTDTELMGYQIPAKVTIICTELTNIIIVHNTIINFLDVCWSQYQCPKS